METQPGHAPPVHHKIEGNAPPVYCHRFKYTVEQIHVQDIDYERTEGEITLSKQNNEFQLFIALHRAHIELESVYIFFACPIHLFFTEHTDLLNPLVHISAPNQACQDFREPAKVPCRSLKYLNIRLMNLCDSIDSPCYCFCQVSVRSLPLCIFFNKKSPFVFRHTRSEYFTATGYSQQIDLSGMPAHSTQIQTGLSPSRKGCSYVH
jgi:hypothetical protein